MEWMGWLGGWECVRIWGLNGNVDGTEKGDGAPNRHMGRGWGEDGNPPGAQMDSFYSLGFWVLEFGFLVVWT